MRTSRHNQLRGSIIVEITDRHRVSSAANLDDGRTAKMCGERIHVYGRAGDDQFEIGSTGKHTFEVAEQEIDIQAAFVGLVDDDGVVLVEPGISLGLCQQNAVCDDLDVCFGSGLVLESDLVTHRLAELLPQVTSDDILQFGLIPELVGRLPVMSALRPLDTDALVRVLSEPKNAVVKPWLAIPHS